MTEATRRRLSASSGAVLGAFTAKGMTPTTTAATDAT
jgi:hypothetical protein